MRQPVGELSCQRAPPSLLKRIAGLFFCRHVHRHDVGPTLVVGRESHPDPAGRDAICKFKDRIFAVMCFGQAG